MTPVAMLKIYRGRGRQERGPFRRLLAMKQMKNDGGLNQVKMIRHGLFWSSVKKKDLLDLGCAKREETTLTPRIVTCTIIKGVSAFTGRSCKNFPRNK